MKHFNISECTRSETATAKGIDNTPGVEHLAHIVETVETLLDPLRDAWEDYCHQFRAWYTRHSYLVRLSWPGTQCCCWRFNNIGTLSWLCFRLDSPQSENDRV